MENLERVILNFNDWSKPWTFHEFITTNNELDDNSKLIFEGLWLKASHFNLWNFSDLKKGMKTSYDFIKSNYELKHETIQYLIQAISYQWK